MNYIRRYLSKYKFRGPDCSRDAWFDAMKNTRRIDSSIAMKSIVYLLREKDARIGGFRRGLRKKQDENLT